MLDLVDRLGAALLDASLSAVTISGLVVLAMVQCRQPARRRGWARAGLLSTLALLPLAALGPVPRLDLRGPLRQILPGESDGPHRPWATGRGGPDRPARAGDEACHPGDTHWARWAARGLVLAYGGGILVGLGAIALGLCGSAWLVRRAGTASADSLARYRSLPYEGRSPRPALRVSDRATRPVLVGVLRPSILIPPDLDRPGSPEPLRLSLLHELAHAEAMDHRFGPAATLAQALWFFLPPVWWIRDQMKLDQEFLADRRAVAHFGSSGVYASSLVDLAATRPSGARSRTTPALAVGATGPARGVTSALIQRVQMLLKCPFAIERRAPAWWRWSTAILLGLATLAASGLTLGGLAGWSSAEPPAVEGDRTFRLPDLVIGQREHDDQPFDLRFRLPDRFTLTFEVLAEPADLPAIEVLGYRLGSAEGPEVDPGRAVYRLWHRVEIRRSRGAETVTVDGRPVEDGTRQIKLAPWLTIRPRPGQTARLRDLELSW